MPFYIQPFFITEKISNNAFNFEKRQEILGKSPSLFVPALKEGTLEEVKIGSEIVFEDFDDNDTLQSCRGLENFVKMSIRGSSGNEVPVYVFDNHNHAFFFWCQEFQKKTFEAEAFLLHVDQHKDNRKPESFLNVKDLDNLEEVFRYTNSVLNVGNFIPPALETDLIRDIFFFDSERALEELEEMLYAHQPNSHASKWANMILDIDLDFFVEEFDYIDRERTFKMLRQLIPQAKMITVATSPFFIEQKRAIEFLKKLFESLEH